MTYDISSGIDYFFIIYLQFSNFCKSLIFKVGSIPLFSLWDLIWSLVFFDIGLTIIVIVVKGLSD